MTYSSIFRHIKNSARILKIDLNDLLDRCEKQVATKDADRAEMLKRWQKGRFFLKELEILNEILVLPGNERTIKEVCGAEGFPRVYLGGPITDIPDYLKHFSHAEDLLKKMGYQIINPAAITNRMPKLSYENCIDLGLKLLSFCDMAFFLPGYNLSTGCQTEIAYAKAMNIPTYKISYGNLSETDLILSTIHDPEKWTKRYMNVIRHSDPDSVADPVWANFDAMDEYVEVHGGTIEKRCAEVAKKVTKEEEKGIRIYPF